MTNERGTIFGLCAFICWTVSVTYGGTWVKGEYRTGTQSTKEEFIAYQPYHSDDGTVIKYEAGWGEAAFARVEANGTPIYRSEGGSAYAWGYCDKWTMWQPDNDPNTPDNPNPPPPVATQANAAANTSSSGYVGLGHSDSFGNGSASVLTWPTAYAMCSSGSPDTVALNFDEDADAEASEPRAMFGFAGALGWVSVGASASGYNPAHGDGSGVMQLNVNP